MKSLKTSVKAKSFRILIVITIFLIVIFSISSILHASFTKNFLDNYPAPGKMVNINGSYMHVLIEGNSDKTIVLLSGLSTAAPALNFRPLLDQLNKDYTTVVVEPFGYGWSNRRNGGCGIDIIVEEYREALKLAGLEPPYILAPHSISGIYDLSS